MHQVLFFTQQRKLLAFFNLSVTSRAFVKDSAIVTYCYKIFRALLFSWPITMPCLVIVLRMLYAPQQFSWRWFCAANRIPILIITFWFIILYRNIGMGTSTASGRVGSFLSSYVIHLVRIFFSFFFLHKIDQIITLPCFALPLARFN